MPQQQLQFINILKAIAIIFVIITHNNFSELYRNNIIFMYFINMAVPMFMLITGFNYSLSFSKIKNNNLKNILKSLFRKFKRLTIPFLVIFLIEWFLILKHNHYNHFMTKLINGGIGPGSYYYPVMVQIILLFPFIYFLVKKYKEKGLIIIFLLQLLFEIICYLTKINPEVYRILSFRYIFLISLGSYLFIKKDKIKSNALIFMQIIGINFITILICTNSKNVYIPFDLWSCTSLMTAFYVLPIFAYFYYNNNKIVMNKVLELLNCIARASWHIFLIQMLYYVVVPMHFKDVYIPLKFMIPISLLVNIFIGLIFFKFEKIIAEYLKSIFKKYLTNM